MGPSCIEDLVTYALQLTYVGARTPMLNFPDILVAIGAKTRLEHMIVGAVLVWQFVMNESPPVCYEVTIEQCVRGYGAAGSRNWDLFVVATKRVEPEDRALIVESAQN